MIIIQLEDQRALKSAFLTPCSPRHFSNQSDIRVYKSQTQLNCFTLQLHLHYMAKRSWTPDHHTHVCFCFKVGLKDVKDLGDKPA